LALALASNNAISFFTSAIVHLQGAADAAARPS
jgi:hypothetical protein